MSNWAALIDVLTIAGSRLSTGEPNSSGTVYFFQPGGNTPVNVYSDAAATAIVTQPLVLTSGGLVNIATVPSGLYVTQPVRVLIQDVDTNTVADTVYVPATAGDVGVSNDGFTDDNLDDVLTKAFTSFGGQDWKYKESGGATERTVKSKFAEIWISVKDFGAVGNGVAIDTTAIQATINRVIALGGGVCYFPPGTYKIDQSIAVSSATGLYIIGSGGGTSVVRQTNASGDAFGFLSCSSCGMQGLTMLADATISVPAISLTSCSIMSFASIAVNSGTGAWAYAVQTVSSSYLSIRDSFLFATTTAVSLVAQSTFTIRDTSISGGAGIGIDLQTTTQNGTVSGCDFRANQATGIKFNTSLSVSGAAFTIEGCPSLGVTGAITTPLDVDSITVALRVRQFGNNTDWRFNQVATGGNITPMLLVHDVIQIQAITGAGTVTVNNPAFFPPETNRIFRFQFMNAAGGAVTWAFGTAYRFAGGAVPASTDGHTIEVLMAFDSQTTKFRECGRADTVTA